MCFLPNFYSYKYLLVICFLLRLLVLDIIETQSGGERARADLKYRQNTVFALNYYS